jgi:Skp family chaperone for outer membrane proteins
MKITQIALAAAVMFGLSSMAGAAFAQSKVFTVDEQQVRQQSKLGKELNAVLETVANQGIEQLGLKTLRTEVDTEGAALKPQIESLTPEAINANPTLKARVDALNRKASELIQKQNALNQTLEQREGGYRLAFLQVLAPAVEAVAKEAGADLVVDVASTWFIKEAIDLTPRVVARLDATVPNVAALQAALPKPPAAPGAAPAPAGAGQ